VIAAGLAHRLVVLAEVADAGGIAPAARRLGVVPSALSHHLAALQRATGATLLRRVGRGIALTSVGEELAARGRAIAREAEAAAMAARTAESPHGHLRIGMPSGIADSLVIPLLSAFLDAFPGLTLDAVASDRLADLAAERLDAAFRIGGVDEGAFVARPLHVGADILVAAPALLARLPPVATPADLRGLPFVGFAAFGRQPVMVLEDEAGVVSEIDVACRVTTTSGLAIRHWAVAGVGIARMPDFTVRAELADGRLLRVLPRHLAGRPTLHLIHLPDRPRPANLRRLIEFAGRHLGPGRPG
jgi:DNA-binding transcriptional LysR family regulator